MAKQILLCGLLLVAMVSSGQAATFEFMRVPSISSMSYRATGGSSWTPATVTGLHGQFDGSPSLFDVEINGQWATHDFTTMSSGAFVTVVGERANEWAFNYDNYFGDESTLWLPVSTVSGGSVPEPTTALLGLMGLLGLGAMRRR